MLKSKFENILKDRFDGFRHSEVVGHNLKMHFKSDYSLLVHEDKRVEGIFPKIFQLKLEAAIKDAGLVSEVEYKQH